MAIANSYPKATPKADDLILGTVTPTPGSTQSPVTRNFEIDALADLIISETGGITGSGTLNTIAMFTPNGQSIGDSLITQASLGQAINVNTNIFVSDDLNVTGSIETSSSLTVEGVSTFNDDATFQTVQFQQAVKDTNDDLGINGQLLVSNAQGYVEWKDPEEVVSGAVAKLIPYTTTATPGGSETYTALNNIVKIGWSGGNGTYVLNIPSATTIPYRVIRFVTNGTYPGGGAHKVRFTPPVGETIDGAAFFETSKVYEGIAVWSTGTEWVIIQAKAH